MRAEVETDYQALNKQLTDLAHRYAQQLKMHLSEQLVSAVLFGSAARGTANEFSDIDLFVVIKDLPAGAFARRAVVEPEHQALQPELDRLLRKDIYTDLIEVLRTPDQAERFHLLYLDMMTEAQFLYDRDHFMEERLARARERAEELGAVRREADGVYYWDLKPDFVPGEVIAL